MGLISIFFNKHFPTKRHYLLLNLSNKTFPRKIILNFTVTVKYHPTLKKEHPKSAPTNKFAYKLTKLNNFQKIKQNCNSRFYDIPKLKRII